MQPEKPNLKNKSKVQSGGNQNFKIYKLHTFTGFKNTHTSYVLLLLHLCNSPYITIYNANSEHHPSLSFWVSKLNSYNISPHVINQGQYLLFLGLRWCRLKHWRGRHKILNILTKNLVLRSQLKIFFFNTIHSLRKICRISFY